MSAAYLPIFFILDSRIAKDRSGNPIFLLLALIVAFQFDERKYTSSLVLCDIRVNRAMLFDREPGLWYSRLLVHRMPPDKHDNSVVSRGVDRFTTLDHPENTLFCRDPFAVARPCVRGTKGSKSSRAGGRPLRDPVVPQGDRHRAGPGCT